MTEPHPSDEPLDLVDQYLSGLLDESQTRELESRLRADAALRRRFVRYCRLHTDLHLEFRARQAGEAALNRLEKSLHGSAAPATPPDAGPAATPLRNDARATLRNDARSTTTAWALWRVPTLVAALSMAVAAAAVGWGWRQAGQASLRPAAEPTIAWLVNAQNCTWADEDPAGDMRAGSTLRLAQGLAEVRFHGGARVVLEGPAALELLSGAKARLLHGKLAARVPESARGFEVLSPEGSVIDLGTEFGMSVGPDGATDVYVFEGEVEARSESLDPAAPGLNLQETQGARIAAGAVLPNEPETAFVRAIVPPPVIVPRTLTMAFNGAAAPSLRDAAGLPTGLTQRLPGTGQSLLEHDEHLRLDLAAGQLLLTATRSDINGQVRLRRGEYLGVRLSDVGFTGQEDFAVAAMAPNIPALEDFGQFGLYAGARSDCNIRGGIIKWGQNDPGYNTQFLVNNDGGRDANVHKVGLLSPGADLRLTLQRIAGKYSLTVENLSDGGASTLRIQHPGFLDGERDLYVGLFAANPYSDAPKTLIVAEFSVTVWTIQPAAGGPREL